MLPTCFTQLPTPLPYINNKITIIIYFKKSHKNKLTLIEISDAVLQKYTHPRQAENSLSESRPKST